MFSSCHLSKTFAKSFSMQRSRAIADYEKLKRGWPREIEPCSLFNATKFKHFVERMPLKVGKYLQTGKDVQRIIQTLKERKEFKRLIVCRFKVFEK